MSSARARLGIDYLDAAPDPAPVIALRARLECDRAAGVAFSEAWRAATRAVLELDANGFELDGRARALSATRDAWAAAYEHRAGAGVYLSAELVQ